MSYNSNFYNKYRGSATFHSNLQPRYMQPPPTHYIPPHAQYRSSPPPYLVPPPPTPPPFFIPPTSTANLDQEFVKHFEHKIPVSHPKPTLVKSVLISDFVEELKCNMVAALTDLKEKEKMLAVNIDTISEEEWSSHMKDVEEKKSLINSTLAHINGPCLDVICKLLAKRAAKRLRLKRVRDEIKKERESRKKELEERSRKIDENLQKIKDDITKAKQENEAKLIADMVLRDVLRKKQDAKKCVVKLDTLIKLRKARANTAKGRGENVPESDTTAFITSIENLKAIWSSKLVSYEAEEKTLRTQLKEDSVHLDTATNVTEREVRSNLERWRELLFGGGTPQVDFQGDIGRFLAVRSQWDQCVSSDGTTLPIGWVTPKTSV